MSRQGQSPFQDVTKHPSFNAQPLEEAQSELQKRLNLLGSDAYEHRLFGYDPNNLDSVYLVYVVADFQNQLHTNTLRIGAEGFEKYFKNNLNTIISEFNGYLRSRYSHNMTFTQYCNERYNSVQTKSQTEALSPNELYIDQTEFSKINNSFEDLVEEAFLLAYKALLNNKDIIIRKSIICIPTEEKFIHKIFISPTSSIAEETPSAQRYFLNAVQEIWENKPQVALIKEYKLFNLFITHLVKKSTQTIKDNKKFATWLVVDWVVEFAESHRPSPPKKTAPPLRPKPDFVSHDHLPEATITRRDGYTELPEQLQRDFDKDVGVGVSDTSQYHSIWQAPPPPKREGILRGGNLPDLAEVLQKYHR